MRETHVERTARVRQLEGLFDLPVSAVSRREWTVDLSPIDQDEWSVGVIVGPSGAGKTTVARELFGDEIVSGFDWPDNRAVIDAFPADVKVTEITNVLSSVGFSSPPSWLRPFRVLSNGEQFRATVARAMVEAQGRFVIDEFTSVVDRTVAQIGSAAVAKTVRRRGQQFIAVSCHYDILDWLEPDWIYEPHTESLARGRLRQRPPIVLAVRPVHHSAWRLFREHHYLTAALNPAAKCFVAFIDNQPVAFCGVLSLPHPRVSSWRVSRIVCLPDFQGVGIGNALLDLIAAAFTATGKACLITTLHPAVTRRLARSTKWHTGRPPTLWKDPRASSFALMKSASTHRSTATFKWVGGPDKTAARALGIA